MLSLPLLAFPGGQGVVDMKTQLLAMVHQVTEPVPEEGTLTSVLMAALWVAGGHSQAVREHAATAGALHHRLMGLQADRKITIKEACQGSQESAEDPGPLDAFSYPFSQQGHPQPGA